ncbi:hypothetical protein [Streptomyces sp. NPDC091219]|uniref:hypothetical protein n=1 Tax=Streptomyces sp. NPDC091219 TaxID=3155193 RepID=UPI0034505694
MAEQADELPPRPGQRRCPGRGAELQRATWRSADMLYRLRLIDRLPSAGRNFRTGKTGNLAQLAPGAKKRVVRYRLNGEARRYPFRGSACGVGRCEP